MPAQDLPKPASSLSVLLCEHEKRKSPPTAAPCGDTLSRRVSRHISERVALKRLALQLTIRRAVRRISSAGSTATSGTNGGAAMDTRPHSGDASGSDGRRGSYGFGAICRYWAPQIGEPPTAGTGVVADGSEAQTRRQQGRGSARGRHAVRATLPAGDALRVASPPPLPPGAGDASCIVLAEARALCELFVDAGGTGWHRSDGWHQLRTHLEAAEAPTVGDGAGVAGNNDAGPTHLWLHGPAQPVSYTHLTLPTTPYV